MELEGGAREITQLLEIVLAAQILGQQFITQHPYENHG